METQTNTRINKDIFLLEICLQNVDCLLNLENSSYKKLFWKNVSETFNKSSKHHSETKQIRDRFKRIYSYYTKIKNTTLFSSRLNTNVKDSYYFKVMHACFSKVYYTNSGILSLVKEKKVVDITTPKVGSPYSILDGLQSIDCDEEIHQRQLCAYMCELNEEGKYQTAAEMMEGFTYKNNSAKNGFTQKFIKNRIYSPLNKICVDDLKNI